MARILITGSADGLGQLAAKSLADQGHTVVLHARNAERARYAQQHVPAAAHILIGDLSDRDETRNVAEQANAWGTFDAVIHNAGVYDASPQDILTVNTLAPYILTCLIHPPQRLIYLGSSMHRQGHARLEHLQRGISYSDSKLYVVLLCMTVARKWREVYANAVNPGWVPTKMGRRGAPDDLHQGYETQCWLAVSNDSQAKVSGRYFYHCAQERPHPQASDTALQEQFLSICADITGISFPA
jgi:NAD(P)-dependent dehydrogenase (short-subunit alcohol dehydrogenase family)